MLYNFLNFICSYFSEKETLKIRKINCKVRIIRIDKYLIGWFLVYLSLTHKHFS